MKPKPPKIYKDVVCIADRDRPELAAVISSYFGRTDYYFGVFEFPGVTASRREYDTDNMDGDTFSIHRADQYETLLNNILARMQFSGTIVLAGLSEDQKSFFHRYNSVNYIEINSLEEVDFTLSPFLDNEREFFRCKEEDVTTGLFIALSRGMVLKIDNFAERVVLDMQRGKGLIVVENEYKTRTLTAIHYAFACGANIAVVSKLQEKEEYYVQHLLNDWQHGDKTAFSTLETMVNDRVGNIRFIDYAWVTFFTQGLPYSLILMNPVPCSYVCVHYNPEFFISNAILFERDHFNGGAVVFSPLFFQDEETRFVAGLLDYQNYLVRAVTGKYATVQNLHMHLREFPYDIFHICSHGGEIKGNKIAEKFTDRYGEEHVIVYEQVLSVTAGREKDMLRVQRMMFYKTLDGKKWGSPELRASHSSEIFTDMHNAMHNSSAEKKKIIEADIVIGNSSHIQCSDSAYQLMTETLSAHSSPVIFNNTCSSWFNIAMPCLGSGARAYIGTAINVDTTDAANYARAFYIAANKDTLMNAAFSAKAVLRNRPAENIYILWGLHFSTLPPLTNKYLVKRHIFFRLSRSLMSWIGKYQETNRQRIKDNIKELMDWIVLQLDSGWTKEDKKQYTEELKKDKK